MKKKTISFHTQIASDVRLSSKHWVPSGTLELTECDENRSLRRPYR